jgi:dTDP-4-amino-4,6-dideoxygalactose transaminase
VVIVNTFYITEKIKMTATKSALAINGGPKSVTIEEKDMFTWPIVTDEDRDAVLDVLNAGAMSGTDITKQFEKEYKEWIGTEYALGYNNGTESLAAAFWACGVGMGDEVICPSITYWASCASVLRLGATVNFADVDPDTLCVDPNDIEHRIGPRTKAIVVVHYSAYPCDMDEIMAIARKHNIKVVEDVSHAHGTLYKGKMTGTIGDVGAMSMMSGKSFACGEAGMLTTNDRSIYERCIAYGHYERTGLASNFNKADKQVTDSGLLKFQGIPIGGYKHRMNQTCAAMGRVQLKHYPERIKEIQKSLNYFWDLLESVPGIKAHRPSKESGSTMGGWYHARGLYRSEELGGLSCEKFCEAVRAEGVKQCHNGANKPLHIHNVFHEADLFNVGKPTAIAFAERDVRQGKGSLPVAENVANTVLGIPWFKHYRPEEIVQYANAYKKVSENYQELL